MRRRIDAVKRATPFISGILIGSALVTPVFAATLTPERIQPWLLFGSVVVLVIALVMQAMATRKTRHDREADRTEQMASRQAENDEGYGAVGDGVFIARRATGTIGDFRVAPRWR